MANPKTQKIKSRKAAGLMLAIAMLFASPCFASSDRAALITGIRLNGVAQQDCPSEINDQGRLFLQQECIEAMKIDAKGAGLVEDSNGSFFDLKSFPGLSYEFDRKKFTVSLTVDPARLPAQIIESGHRQGAAQQSIFAGFLNYGIQSSFNDTTGFLGATINNELGISKGDNLFLTDGFLTESSTETRYTRLMSRFIHNDRGSLTKTTLGDVAAFGGPLSSSSILGGLQLAKSYDIDPYLNTHPTTFNYSGLAQLGGEVDVSVNGQIVKTAKIAPGQYTLTDIQGFSGQNNFDVVVKDPFGNTQSTAAASFYATDALLKAGFSDYSYSLGLLRPRFGQDDSYGRPTFLYWHKKGITDRLTLGIQGEARPGLVNQGASITQQLGRFGIFSATVAGSLTESRPGAAGLLGYSYTSGSFNALLSGQTATADYHVAAGLQDAQRTRNSASTSIGYGNTWLGSLSGQVTAGQMFDGSRFVRESASYSRPLSRFSTLTAMVSNNRQSGQNNLSAFLTLTFYPDGGHIYTTGAQIQGDETRITAEASKSLPAGEGYGYDLKTAYSPRSGTTEIRPTVNLNARNFTAQVNTESTSSKGTWSNSGSVNLAGGLIFTPGTVAATRPVTSSFAVVEIGAPLAGVKVYNNNLPISTTDSSGKAIIPSGLIAYNDNKISLGGADIPVDYQIKRKSATVNPAARSGNRVCLPVTRLQALTATLVAEEAGGQVPLKLAGVQIRYADGKELEAGTGTDGELYIDSSSLASPTLPGSSLDGCAGIGSAAAIKPGSYQGTVEVKGKKYGFTLSIPDQGQQIYDLGTIVCKPIQEAKL